MATSTKTALLRARAKKIIKETMALRRIATQGYGMVCAEAFGPAYPHSVHALRAQGYHYTIRYLGTGLELEIDTYSAFLAPVRALDGVGFDEEVFEKLLIVFESSQATRHSYQALRHIARSVLDGAAIRLADGQVRNFLREALGCTPT